MRVKGVFEHVPILMESTENLHVHSKLIQILTLTRPLTLSKNNTKRTFANAE